MRQWRSELPALTSAHPTAGLPSFACSGAWSVPWVCAMCESCPVWEQGTPPQLSTFQCEKVAWMDGWMDWWKEGWMDDGCKDGWMEGWVDGWMDGKMDRRLYIKNLGNIYLFKLHIPKWCYPGQTSLYISCILFFPMTMNYFYNQQIQYKLFYFEKELKKMFFRV